MMHFDAHSHIQLKDGRTLSYFEAGNLHGYPVLFFHSFPGCMLDVLVFDGPQHAMRQGIRLIAPDRPGFGASTYVKNRTISDHVEDIKELIAALHIERFSILALSSGSAYAIASALAMENMLDGLHLVSALLPDLHTAGKGLIPKLHKLTPLRLWWYGKRMEMDMEKNPDSYFKRGQYALADLALLQSQTTRGTIQNAILGCTSHGYTSLQAEAKCLRSGIEGDVEALRLPVTFWHGGDDAQVPIQSARTLASQLVNTTFHEIENGGHLSVIVSEISQIYQTIQTHRKRGG